MQQLYKITYILCFVCVGLSVVSLPFSVEQKGIFGWLFLGFPALWFLWICCVFIVNIKQFLWRLVKLWVFIDFSILILFLSFSNSIDNWTRSNGIDMVVLISYLPFWILPRLLTYVIPQTFLSVFIEKIDLLERLCGSGMCSTVILWLVASVFATFQSLLLITLSRYIRKDRESITGENRGVKP